MSEPSIESIFTPEMIADPYPTYKRLREDAPVLELPDNNLTIVTRYADVQQVLRDKRMGHDNFAGLSAEEMDAQLANPAVDNLNNTMLLMNPPDHSRLRSLVVRAFDARRVEAMRVRIRQIANDLIDKFIQNKQGDLKTLLTHPLPVIVICDMLGIPKADQAEFTKGTRISGRLIDPTPMSDQELAAANQSTLESRAYFEDLCNQRRAQPQDDLTTALVQSESEQGKLSQNELTANISLLFAAGHETTVNLMGNALLALFRHPDQLNLLRDKPELMPNAVEEFLRYDSSVQLSGRHALRDADVAGVNIPKGRMVLTLLGAANRDPLAYDNPNQLDIRREKNKPLSFGGGIHLCLGAQLARIETAETLNILLQRLPNLALTNLDTPSWKQTITLRGLDQLPATW